MKDLYRPIHSGFIAFLIFPQLFTRDILSPINETMPHKNIMHKYILNDVCNSRYDLDAVAMVAYP